MMHFFRKSKIHLDCFVNRPSVLETAPIDRAINVIPEWWKALPKEYFSEGSFVPQATMKTCRGVYDYYAQSISIPLWSEVAIGVDENKGYGWQFSDLVTEGVVHPQFQYEGFDTGFTGHIKITSPWLFKESEGVKWVFSSPLYSQHTLTDYITLPGVVEYKYQHGTNIQLFINLERKKTFRIACGTPLAFITPMSDKKVVVHNHLISNEEYGMLEEKHRPMSFINKYMNYKQTQASKCPFNWRS